MLQDFNNHLEKNLSYLKDKKLLIAISGGVDSVVLTCLLKMLNFNVSLAHCNFQLRGEESDLDELFIKDLGEDLLLQTFIVSFNTKEYCKEKKISTQVAARELRYNYFETLIQEHSFDYVLTAHHADDNLETFLINLTRGTGLEGLAGIPLENGKIIRPLLPFSRSVILNFANEHAIKWREDKSNSEDKYVRNKIRHQVIPVLKSINPSLLSSFNNTSEYLKENITIVNDRISDLSERIIIKEKGVLKMDINQILRLSNPKAYLYQFLKKYHFNEWNKVYDLLTAQSGKYLLTNSHILLKNRDFLVLSYLKDDKFLSSEKYYIYEKQIHKIDFPIKISVINSEKIKVDYKKTILVDKNLVIYPLVIRKREEGDFFYPKGMSGKKKVSKFFKDEKLSLIDKQNTWLLCDKNDTIIWIIGLRFDRRFQINNNTKSILKISI